MGLQAKSLLLLSYPQQNLLLRLLFPEARMGGAGLRMYSVVLYIQLRFNLRAVSRVQNGITMGDMQLFLKQPQNQQLY